MHDDEIQPERATPREQRDDRARSEPLVAGVDYYVERGCLVFTREYHLKRGYCCNSGCRHCPYEKEGE